MEKFEYTQKLVCLSSGSYKEVDDRSLQELNRLGAKGWEIIQWIQRPTGNYTVILKRKIVEDLPLPDTISFSKK